MKPLDVLGVRVEMPTNQPVVLLQERGSSRCVPIWIGAAEATAIAYAQQGVEPPRPLTHDLLKNILDVLGHELAEVRILRMDEGVFYAVLVIDGAEIDARSSDAIALALRTGTPIVAPAELIEEVSVPLAGEGEGEEDTDDEVARFKEFLDSVSPEDFEPGADQDGPPQAL